MKILKYSLFVTAVILMISGVQAFLISRKMDAKVERLLQVMHESSLCREDIRNEITDSIQSIVKRNFSHYSGILERPYTEGHTDRILPLCYLFTPEKDSIACIYYYGALLERGGCYEFCYIYKWVSFCKKENNWITYGLHYDPFTNDFDGDIIYIELFEKIEQAPLSAEAMAKVLLTGDAFLLSPSYIDKFIEKKYWFD